MSNFLPGSRERSSGWSEFAVSSLVAVGVLGGYFALLGWWPAWEALWLLPTVKGAWFSDAYAVLAASDVHAAGYNPYGENPLGIRHLYPRLWFGLDGLGLGREDALLAGLVLGGGFLGAALLWLRPRTVGGGLYVMAVLLSPPITLGVQRGNSDLLIFLLMLALALVSGARSAVARNGFGLVVWLGATLLKFYPVVVAPVFLWLEKDRRGRMRTGAMLAFGLALAAWPLWEDYQRVVELMRHFKTGESVIHRFGINFAPPLVGWTVAGMVVCAGMVVWGWRSGAKVLPGGGGEVAERGFLFGSVLLLGCFAAGGSYVYRLVFVLLLIPWWWRLKDEGQTRLARGLAMAGLVLTPLLFWRDGAVGFLLQWGRDLGSPPFHIWVIKGHRVALCVIEWLWCAAVAGLLAAMARGRWSEIRAEERDSESERGGRSRGAAFPSASHK